MPKLDEKIIQEGGSLKRVKTLKKKASGPLLLTHSMNT